MIDYAGLLLTSINKVRESQVNELLSPINAFLKCPTPQSWINEATKRENLPVVLLDHLVCELKAAQSAMYLIRKYAVDKESGEALLARAMSPCFANAWMTKSDSTSSCTIE